MTVILTLEPGLEQGLRAQAQARGVTVKDFIHDLVRQQVRMSALGAAKTALKLSARDLGDVGSLHRRDIYDDVR